MAGATAVREPNTVWKVSMRCLSNECLLCVPSALSEYCHTFLQFLYYSGNGDGSICSSPVYEPKIFCISALLLSVPFVLFLLKHGSFHFQEIHSSPLNICMYCAQERVCLYAGLSVF